MDVETVRELTYELELVISRLVREHEIRTGVEVTSLDRRTATVLGGLRPYNRTVAINISVAL